MLTPKMQMVGSRSAADLAFEGEGGGGTLVSGLQIYFCDSIPIDLLTFVFVVP